GASGLGTLLRRSTPLLQPHLEGAYGEAAAATDRATLDAAGVAIAADARLGRGDAAVIGGRVARTDDHARRLGRAAPRLPGDFGHERRRRAGVSRPHARRGIDKG